MVARKPARCARRYRRRHIGEFEAVIRATEYRNQVRRRTRRRVRRLYMGRVSYSCTTAFPKMSWKCWRFGMQAVASNRSSEQERHGCCYSAGHQAGSSVRTSYASSASVCPVAMQTCRAAIVRAVEACSTFRRDADSLHE